MTQPITSSPPHLDTPSTSSSPTLCPLCDEEIALDIAEYKISAKWREALPFRDRWAAVAAEFRRHQSIEGAAKAVELTPETAEYLLRFLCMEVCGCRAATCVSCLDDYRCVL